MPSLSNSLLAALQHDTLAETQAVLLAANPAADLVNQPLDGRPPLVSAQSKEMVDLLLAHGASTDAVGAWWAPGFDTHAVPTPVAAYLVQHGTPLSIHAAAGLGLTSSVHEKIAAQPSCVHARGGDGCTPLHFARNAEVAALLLAHGADPDARDEDHDSTPAQWCIQRAPDVTRLLLTAGATPDIFMAAGLGDTPLAQTLIHENPDCTTFRIGINSGPFPGIGHHGRGGTIYQWTLGFNQSPHEIAYARGHHDLYRLLLDHTPPRHRFLVACMMADSEHAASLLQQHPAIMGALQQHDLALLAICCWETNLQPDAVHLMLELGFPVDTPEHNHGYSPLHNAAWCGHAGLVTLLLKHGHAPDIRDPAFHSTPLGFALHSCLVARGHPEGAFPEVVDLLLEAGAPLEPDFFPTGQDHLDAIFRQHGAGPVA